MERQVQECQFTTHDGVQLFYRYWPAMKKAKKAIVMFHRGHEHGGRMAHLVDELVLPDFAFFAWDARGHGQSPGERGESPSVAASILDIQHFIEHLRKTYDLAEQQLTIIAQSISAVLVSAWVHDYAPNIRCMILAAPAFKVKLYVPFAREGLLLLQHFWGNFFVNSYVKSKLLTHDVARQQSYDSDPLIAKAISVKILLGLYDLGKRLLNNAASIYTPTQIFISTSDWVVHNKPQQQFYQRLASQCKELHQLHGFFHDILGEKERKVVISRMKRFIEQNYQCRTISPYLVNADKVGEGCAQWENLNLLPSSYSPSGIYWSVMRSIMQWAKKYSDGIELGFNTGFDSGSSMDYVYRNHASGKGKLGKFIDSCYLNAIGWRGIRERKINIEMLLMMAIEKLREQQQSIHIVDVAAGHGRYIIDTITQLSTPPDSVLLQDYNSLNVQQGTQLIIEKSLEGLVRFIQGDAFDAEHLAQIHPRATLTVVSGLYELFSDNQQILQSLHGIANGLVEGGLLLYTCQPWHPQLTFIARTLTSHRDNIPWVMRPRSQVEMDQLIQAAGFEKITQRTDEWGIFSVSLARKVC